MSSGDERIGLLGGTFDPIHVGHLAAANAAAGCARLDRVIFVPTGQPPHRPPAAAAPEHRLEMARLATAEDARFAVSDLLATIVVVARPGSGSPQPADLEAAGLRGSSVILCLERTPNVSASGIRKDIKSGKSITGKVPPPVERYIAAHHLYVE